MEEPAPTRLILIGTGHVFDIEQTIRDAVVALRPEHVFVELDMGRYRALMERRGGAVAAPAGKWVHRRLQAFQEKMAQQYGAEAGGEMLAAVEGAGLVGARPHLIDRRVDVTLQRALSQLTLAERIRALAMIVGSTVANVLPLPGRSVEDELEEYNSDPEGTLDALERKFPTVRRVLIDERDDVMAARMRTILAHGGFGVAVVGDGHIPGLLRRLEDLQPDTYRLPDVRAGRLPKPDPSDTASVSFSFGP